MVSAQLIQVAVFLAAAAIAAPLGRCCAWAPCSAIWPPASSSAHTSSARFTGRTTSKASCISPSSASCMLLFVIGLELRPDAAVVDAHGHLRRRRRPRWRSPGLRWRPSASASAWPGRRRCSSGLALSLSSTAFALQVLEEKGELTLRHGRLAFAVLLFQDLVAIPLIALSPLFSVARKPRRRI